MPSVSMLAREEEPDMEYNPNPVFKAGDKVICTGSRGYCFTTNKEYTVLSYEPVNPMPTFTWPAYVEVEDDYGQKVHCHASRFINKEK